MHIEAKTSNGNSGGPMETFWGQSSVSISDAIQLAAAAAHQKLGPKAVLEWFELLETRGGFNNGVLQFQVAVRIGYIPG